MLAAHHIKRLLLSIAVIVVAGVVAYWIKSAAIEKQRQLEAINAQIDREEDRIIVLEADWAYLTRSARIGRLAQEMLGFAPVAPQRILSGNSLAGGEVSPNPAPADAPSINPPSLDTAPIVSTPVSTRHAIPSRGAR